MKTVLAAPYKQLDLSHGYSLYTECWSRRKLSMDILMRDLCGATQIEMRYPIMTFLIRNAYAYNIYKDGFVDVINSVAQIPITDRPYCYIMLGVHAGDCKEARTLKDIVVLAEERIPVEGWHYFFEGVAISLGYELVEQKTPLTDVIRDIPPCYQHYFLIQYGRLLEAYYAKPGGWKYAVEQINHMDLGGMERYIYQGLIWSMLYGKSEDEQIEFIKDKFPAWYYRRLGEQDDARKLLSAVPVAYKKYMLEGIFKEIFEEAIGQNPYYMVDIEDLILNKIKKMQERKNYVVDVDQPWFYRALGWETGLYTFGHLPDSIHIEMLLSQKLSKEYFRNFYLGYSMAIRARYGEDSSLIEHLIRSQMPKHFVADCLSAT